MFAEWVTHGAEIGTVAFIAVVVLSRHHTALYIELKRRKGGRVSEEQRGWIGALNRVGCRAVVCYGWEEARNEIEDYLRH